MNVAALAGGVGGARLAEGLAQCLSGVSPLAVIVNTGDDFDHLGLRICPDLDTVMYTLAGLADPAAGWGLGSETWNALDMLGRYGAEIWFKLGDRDLAAHVYRTHLLRQGLRLTQVTETLCQALSVGVRVLPMSDEPVATMVQSDGGELAFQDYFVRRAWQPVLRGVRFEGIERARPTPEVIGALEAAELVVLCPSNPFVSLDPILALPGVRERSRERWHGGHVVAVSPIIGGQAVKGPAAKMFRELGLEPSPLSVARHYADILNGLVIDKADVALQADIEAMGIRVLVTDALMRDRPDRARLAGELLHFATGNGTRIYTDKHR